MRIVLQEVDKREEVIPALESDSGEHHKTAARAELATCESETLGHRRKTYRMINYALDDFPR